MALPEHLGRLHRVSRLGAGAFATVWLYRDDASQSWVAVKALTDSWSDRADVSERFLEEARVLRRADSDHVVRVYDIGETGDVSPYFVMAYADKGTVGDLVPQAPRPPEEVADIVWQAAQGLGVLHHMGVVHRDVKPQNLLLQTGPSGETRLVVADLGLAKALAFSSGQTLVVGTPEYMAPEQVDPSAGVDARADVHALAAVAYHLLTGKPVRADGLAALTNPSAPAPPSLFVPGVTRQLDEVLARAFALNPQRRYSDIVTFASEFGQATYSRPQPRSPGAAEPVPAETQYGVPLAGAVDVAGVTSIDLAPSPQPAPAVPAPPAVTTRRSSWWPRWPWLVTGVVVAVLAGAGAYWALRDPEPARRAAESPPSSPTTSRPTQERLALALPARWAETERDAGTVTYREPDRDLLARVSRTTSEEDVRTVAKDELDRVSAAAGYALISSRPLPQGRRRGWDSGWLIEYGYVIDGQRRVQQAWYVGDAAGTAGFVAVAAPRGHLTDVARQLPRALGVLTP